MQRKEYCEANKQFQRSLQVGQDQEVQRLVDESYLLCQGPTATPAIIETTEEPTLPTATPTDTPVPDGGGDGGGGGT